MLGRHPHDLFNVVRRDPRRAATSFALLTERGQPFTGEPVSPGAHSGRGDPYGRGDVGVGHTVGSHQQHLGPFHLPVAAVEDRASTITDSR